MQKEDLVCIRLVTFNKSITYVFYTRTMLTLMIYLRIEIQYIESVNRIEPVSLRYRGRRSQRSVSIVMCLLRSLLDPTSQLMSILDMLFRFSY